MLQASLPFAVVNYFITFMVVTFHGQYCFWVFVNKLIKADAIATYFCCTRIYVLMVETLQFS